MSVLYGKSHKLSFFNIAMGMVLLYNKKQRRGVNNDSFL